jgi:hypothetical protein
MLILPTDSMPTLQYFMNNNRELVYSFLLTRMKDAIEHNWTSMEIFRVGKTNFVARIDQENYEQSIIDMKNFFVEKQEYEKAAMCSALLDKHRVNMMLQSQK